jgi:hypothetical protein
VTDNGRAVVENNQVGGAHHRTGGQQCVRHAPMRLLVHWRLACNVRIGHVRTTRGMQRAVSHWDRLGCSESQGLWHAHCVPPCMSFGRVWCGLYRAPPVTPPAPGLGSLRRHIGTGTGITPRPHRHRDRDHPAATSAPGPGSPRCNICDTHHARCTGMPRPESRSKRALRSSCAATRCTLLRTEPGIGVRYVAGGRKAFRSYDVRCSRGLRRASTSTPQPRAS